METLLPCASLEGAELICVAAGDITTAAGGAPASAGLTGDLQETLDPSQLAVERSSKAPIRPYTSVVNKRKLIFINKNEEIRVTVKICS
jgi:hypothetical protein